MAVKSITVNHAVPVGRQFWRQVAIQVTGTYAAPETIDFTTMLNPKKISKGKFAGVASSTKALPADDDIQLAKGPDGYDFVLSRAASSPTLKNYTLTIYSSGDTALAGSYPATLDSVDIVFNIIQPLKYA